MSLFIEDVTASGRTINSGNADPASSAPTRSSPAASSLEDRMIGYAIRILERRMFSAGPEITQPSDISRYLRLKLAGEPNELFAVVFLDARHKVIAYEPLFRGTVNQTVAHPRVVIQRALFHNAAAVVLAHQHPSGSIKPSDADIRVTTGMRNALKLFDIRLLDHFIIGEGEPFSFLQSGLL